MKTNNSTKNTLERLDNKFAFNKAIAYFISNYLIAGMVGSVFVGSILIIFKDDSWKAEHNFIYALACFFDICVLIFLLVVIFWNMFGKSSNLKK